MLQHLQGNQLNLYLQLPLFQPTLKVSKNFFLSTFLKINKDNILHISSKLDVIQIVGNLI